MADKLADMAKKEFEDLTAKKTELQSQMAEIDKKIKPLTAYLQAIGAIKSSKRGRKPKAESKE
jgi:flagellar biosynthesis chaperone FliJ